MVERTGALRPQYVMFQVRVARTERLGPSFVRITFTGDELHRFGIGGADQRVKLILPLPGRTLADMPGGDGWYTRWQAMPDETRPTLRTYTVRAHREEPAELDIDFVLHGVDSGHGGPASTWAAAAAPGDEVALLGPDRPGTGRMWGCEWSPPQTARRLVLAGDETAVPAMAAIVESLPADSRGVVCAEVPTAEDVQDWRAPRGVEIRWLVRQRPDGPLPHGALLEASVTGALGELGPRADQASLDDVDVDADTLWEVPEAGSMGGDLYGWLAGEAAVIKRLRRLLVQEHSVPRASVAFMGYWRDGHS
ncbi:siderophore-interacting protein [Saccharopolyspora gloriosae]|uniref:siderophore-interacting protein n=1 Tax=Saccharopolyspora gloriosae TaxID=455344 RepID=UPI001FB5EAD6|nr:siderophore-interacting protein [Saccharopolyspora gloriosae]